MTSLPLPTLPAGAAAAAAERFAAAAEPDVAFDVLQTPVGPLLAAVTPVGLARTAYTAGADPDEILDQLADRLSPRVLRVPGRLDDTRRELEEYFAGTRRAFDLSLDWRLTTPFQRRVLTATAAIPYGETGTYSEVAAAAGSPSGARAAGNALGANPIPIVVPCHRILRGGGALGGYTGGLDVKRTLLALEGAERAPRLL